MFSEGLHTFNRDFNTAWDQVLKERISDKSKEESWTRFYYLLHYKKAEEDPEDTTSVDFDWKRVEQRKWVHTFKYMGP